MPRRMIDAQTEMTGLRFLLQRAERCIDRRDIRACAARRTWINKLVIRFMKIDRAVIQIGQIIHGSGMILMAVRQNNRIHCLILSNGACDSSGMRTRIHDQNMSLIMQNIDVLLIQADRQYIKFHKR